MASLSRWVKPGLRQPVKLDGWMIRQGAERAHLQRNDEFLGHGQYKICISMFFFLSGS